MNANDTIIAISSAVGPAARLIVRLSGPASHPLVQGLSTGSPALEHAHAVHRQLNLHGLSVPATVYSFLAPRSSTGQDVVELHVPGSSFLAKRLVTILLQAGARQADAGEFTARAYFNGKLDLAAAEGVAAVIAAANRRELDAARKLLAGALAARLTPIMESLAQTLALVEVGIDFSDEDVTFLSRDQVCSQIRLASAALQQLLLESPRLERLSHEPRVALAGRPNAGKSTLLNALAGEDRAIVSDRAGTTRDALSARIRLPRGIVTMVDIAGLESATDSQDVIDIQMKHTAINEIESADIVVAVRAVDDPRPMIPLPREPALIALTKSDLRPGNESELQSPTSVRLSARDGQGIADFFRALDQLAFGTAAPEGTLALAARHVGEIENALTLLGRAEQQLDAGAEFVAFELRATLDALGAVLGTITPDDVLGRVFSTFCIGK